MLLYHKKVRMFILLFLGLIGVSFIPFTASAASLSLELNSLLRADVSYNEVAEITNLDDSLVSGNRSIANYRFTLSSRLLSLAYESSLYYNGVARFYVDIPLNDIDSNWIIGANVTSQPTYSNNNGVSVFTFYNIYYSYIRVYYNVFCDNYYANKLNNYMFADNFDINISLSLPNDYLSSVYYLRLGEPTLHSYGVNMKTSVLPSVTSGDAGVISEAVLFAIEQSYIEENQNVTNQHLSTIITWLSTIKAQDLNYYNQIVQKIAEQTANDNRLYELLYNTLQSDLYGDHSISTPWGEADFHGFVGDLLAQIGVEIAYFRMLYNSYARANQTEAEEVNDAAASQEEAMNSLADSLAVPTRDFNSNFDNLDNQFNDEVVSDQGRLFFFLNPRYNIIVTILVTATSFGLIGFILYGKGG